MAIGERSRQSLRFERDSALAHKRQDGLIESDADRRKAEFIGSRLRAFKSREQIQQRKIPDFGI